MIEELKVEINLLEQEYIDAFTNHAPRDQLQKIRDDIKALEERLQLINSSRVASK